MLACAQNSLSAHRLTVGTDLCSFRLGSELWSCQSGRKIERPGLDKLFKRRRSKERAAHLVGGRPEAALDARVQDVERPRGRENDHRNRWLTWIYLSWRSCFGLTKRCKFRPSRVSYGWKLTAIRASEARRRTTQGPGGSHQMPLRHFGYEHESGEPDGTWRPAQRLWSGMHV